MVHCVVHDPERVWMRGGREIYAEEIEAGEWTKDDLFRISFNGETILAPWLPTRWRRFADDARRFEELLKQDWYLLNNPG